MNTCFICFCSCFVKLQDDYEHDSHKRSPNFHRLFFQSISLYRSKLITNIQYEVQIICKAYSIDITIELMFAGVNMFLARLRLILPRAKMSSEKGQKYIYAQEHQLYYYYNNFKGHSQKETKSTVISRGR